jgi:hypothetical protein
VLLRHDVLSSTKRLWHIQQLLLLLLLVLSCVQAGVAESKWAIEYEQPAADAFRMNNPQTAVYARDCNAILAVRVRGAAGV